MQSLSPAFLVALINLLELTCQKQYNIPRGPEKVSCSSCTCLAHMKSIPTVITLLCQSAAISHDYCTLLLVTPSFIH